MSNLFAAIGLVQLERFEREFRPLRKNIAIKYHQTLRDIKDIILFPDNYETIVPHIFPLRIVNNKRDGLRQHLLDNNIECGIHYYPNHLLTYYGARRGALPITEKVYKELLTLPLHPDLTEEDQNWVIKKVRDFFNKS
jgi:dTDP-4-amino-4,6-dideoxygalactose transaminase